jgi:DNA-binding transcriptional regulator GbsR (MarR family)
LYSEYLTEEVLKGFGDLNMRGQVITTVKYVSDLMLLAKEETVLQGMIESLIEIGRCYGMERSVGKVKVMRISRQTSPV